MCRASSCPVAWSNTDPQWHHQVRGMEVQTSNIYSHALPRIPPLKVKGWWDHSCFLCPHHCSPATCSQFSAKVFPSLRWQQESLSVSCFLGTEKHLWWYNDICRCWFWPWGSSQFTWRLCRHGSVWSGGWMWGSAIASWESERLAFLSLSMMLYTADGMTRSVHATVSTLDSEEREVRAQAEQSHDVTITFQCRGMGY